MFPILLPPWLTHLPPPNNFPSLSLFSFTYVLINIQIPYISTSMQYLRFPPPSCFPFFKPLFTWHSLHSSFYVLCMWLNVLSSCMINTNSAWKHVASAFLGLAYFSGHKSLQFYPLFCKWHNVILACRWIKLRCIYRCTHIHTYIWMHVFITFYLLISWLMSIWAGSTFRLLWAVLQLACCASIPVICWLKFLCQPLPSVQYLPGYFAVNL